MARGDWNSGYWHGGFLQLRSGGTYDGQCGTPQCETVSAGDVLFFANTNVKWNSLYIRPYLLHLRENATADNLDIERRITNTGFRVEGTHPNAFYTLDGAIQTGQASSKITHQACDNVNLICQQLPSCFGDIFDIRTYLRVFA